MRRSLIAAAAAILTFLLAAAPASAQAPNGIYLMTRMWASSLETNVYYFGLALAVNAPNYDIAAFGPDHAVEQNPGLVGDLTVGKGTMRIDWRDGKVTEAGMEPSTSGCFYWDGGLFCPVQTFTSSTISGVFYGGDAVGGGTSAFASQVRTVLFKGDGTYAMGSTASIDSIAGGVDASATGEQVETGRYRIGANTIDFQSDGGQSWSTASFPYHDKDEAGDFPNRIYFDGVMMTRQ